MPKANTSEKRKIKCNAVDYFIIIAIVLCIAGVGLRIAVGNNGGSLSSPVVMEDYILSFHIADIRNTSTEYLGVGEQFYIESTEQYFGEIADSIAVTPALFYVENSEGHYVQTYAPENGDATRVDVTGTMRVSGYMGENGFLLGGNTNIAANKELTLRNKNLEVKITVTGIEKAS